MWLIIGSIVAGLLVGWCGCVYFLSSLIAEENGLDKRTATKILFGGIVIIPWSENKDSIELVR